MKAVTNPADLPVESLDTQPLAADLKAARAPGRGGPGGRGDPLNDNGRRPA